MNKMSAIIFILNKLNQGIISTNNLAIELNLSTRTIQRYIKEIEEAEFPLYSPKYGSYSFVEGFSLQKMKLSDKEACLMILLKGFVESLNNPIFDKTFSELKKRILKEDDISPFYVKNIKAIKYQKNDVTKQLEKFIQNNQQISFDYLSGDQKIYHTPNISPVKIANYDGFWYLITFDGNKPWKFRIPNIKSIITNGKYFKYPKNINKILSESTNIYFETKRNNEVKMLISNRIKQYFKDKQYFPSQKIERENKDGSIVLTCKISKEEEIIPTILHWIPNIKVLSPQNLSREIKWRVLEYIKIFES